MECENRKIMEPFSGNTKKNSGSSDIEIQKFIMMEWKTKKL